MASSSGSKSDLLLGPSEQEFIRQGCAADIRSDGRTRHDFRTFYIATEVVTLSHGSARLLSSTNQIQMLCSVKAELVTPSPNRPNDGVVEVAIDQHDISNHRNSRLREVQMALNRVRWLDARRLCVIPGVAVWRLFVDLFILSTDFVSLDAASHCIRHALANTLLPAITVNAEDYNGGPGVQDALDQMQVNSDIAMAKPVVSSVDDVPLIVTVTIVPVDPESGSSNPHTPAPQQLEYVLLHDADAMEDACSTAAVHVTLLLPPSTSTTTGLPPNKIDDRSMTKAASIQAVSKSGTGSLPIALLPTCVQAAVDAVEKVSKHYIKTVDVNNRATAVLFQEPLTIQ